MKLDENVCRGSLIIHGHASYAVVSGRAEVYHKGTLTYRGWAIMPVTWFKVDGSIYVGERIHVAENEEVEMFFPGVVYPLPTYIK